MGIWESALMLLGIGIISSKFKAGVGLGELGLGIRELTAAPLGGLGTGLGEFGGGLRIFAESLGDIGRGFGDLFAFIPQWARPGLSTDSGGADTDLYTGGGGNVPPGVETWWTMDVAGLPLSRYAWVPSPKNGYEVWAA